jgi:single-strand DNA-binding protein
VPGGIAARDIPEVTVHDTTVTLVGNLVEDPRFSGSEHGVARVRFRLASTSRRYDRATAEWVDGDTLFMTVIGWRSLAEHCHESLRKGDRVVVFGRLRRREWVTADGQSRAQLEIDADAVGPDLQRAAVMVVRVKRPVASAPPPEAGADSAAEAFAAPEVPAAVPESAAA